MLPPVAVDADALGAAATRTAEAIGVQQALELLVAGRFVHAVLDRKVHGVLLTQRGIFPQTTKGRRAAKGQHPIDYMSEEYLVLWGVDAELEELLIVEAEGMALEGIDLVLNAGGPMRMGQLK